MTMDKFSFKTDLEKGYYRNTDSIASLIPYEYEGIHYALAINASPLLRTYFIAAIVTYLKRENDVNFEDILTTRDLKDVSDEKSITKFEVVRDIVVDCSYGASKIIEKFYKENHIVEEDSFHLYLFIMSMARLCTSFKAAVSLLNNGFFVEVAPVYRLILEQLAWGCYLLNECDEEQIIKNQITKNISYLKSVLKDDKFGNLYGYLSNEAHLDIKTLSKYIAVNEEKGTINVRGRSGQTCDDETYTLLLLLKAYVEVVFEGISQYNFMTVNEKQYYTDWHNCQFDIIATLRQVLDGKDILTLEVRE